MAYLVALRSVDKEAVEIARLEDRLALLVTIGSRTGAAVALCNVGLYVDQARAFREALPDTRLSFVVGFDKLVQILDPRYYEDRGAALDDLFALADLLVLPRGDDGPAEIAAVLAEAGNARWAGKIHPLAAPPSLDLQLSATAIRQADLTATAQAAALPPEVQRFVEQWQPYPAAAPQVHGAAQHHRPVEQGLRKPTPPQN